MEISMEPYEKLEIRMRDCFTAGYTLPQYCIDNGINKPLFVSDEKLIKFVWEIFVQFGYDKRLMPQFSFLDLPMDEVRFSINNIIGPVKFKNFSEINPADFDAIILLTTEKVEVKSKVKVINFFALTKYFLRKVYAEIPALNFLKRFPGVKLFYTILPNDLERYEGGKEFIKTFPDVDKIVKNIKAGKNVVLPAPYDKSGYTNQDFASIVDFGKTVSNPDGTSTMRDNDSFPVKIKNGKRLTANQPEKFKNRIYFMGPCHFAGLFASYDKTIESYLQKMLNEHKLPYRVENESQRVAFRYQDMFYNLNKLNPAPGDIVFLWLTNNLHADNIPFVDLSDAFDPPQDYRKLYIVDRHFNEQGYKVLAEKFFEILTENNFFRDKEYDYPMPPPVYHRYGIPSWAEQSGAEDSFVSKELENYKKQLKAKRPKIGALVMNCNPFTLGHKYLVEYAAAKVDKLYIFVVEEDKSEFPFADRIELVKKGVKEFSNVEVLPSGKFIISQTTFSGYFNKAELQDVTVDSSEDVEIFGREIAPTLGITVRFAGEEPKDNVTRQYNETMKKILPRYGVEFCEIPRKEFFGEPISASAVRKSLKLGDFDFIKDLVPETTFNYLLKKYSTSK